MIKYLAKLFVRKYFESIRKKRLDIADVNYLKDLLQFLESDKFSQSLLTLNNRNFYVGTQFNNIEEEIKCLVRLINALDKKSNIYRELLSREIKLLHVTKYFANSKNEIYPEIGISALKSALETFINSYCLTQGEKDEISKTNIYLLQNYINNLCSTLESIIHIQFEND